MPHPAKATIVDDLHKKLNASPFLFVADYTGLKVSQFAELRNRLNTSGARCHVVKNTFLRRAAKEAGLPELAELKGQTAIIVGDKDVAATAKVLKNFTAEFKKPEVKTGIVDKVVVTTAQIAAIADLPSREVLLATLLGCAQRPGEQAGPRAQRAGVLAGPAPQSQSREGRRACGVTLFSAGASRRETARVAIGARTLNKQPMVPRRSGGCRFEIAEASGSDDTDKTYGRYQYVSRTAQRTHRPGSR